MSSEIAPQTRETRLEVRICTRDGRLQSFSTEVLNHGGKLRPVDKGDPMTGGQGHSWIRETRRGDVDSSVRLVVHTDHPNERLNMWGTYSAFP
jgi:hypothetical protein